MKLKLFEAKLKTAGKTTDDIISQFEGEIKKKEIQNWINVFNLIDGTEVIVSERHNRYMLFTWYEKDDDIIKELIYQAEQDELFGMYQNDREGFLKDWTAGEYEPNGVLSFDEKDVEIIRELKRESDSDE